MKIYITGLGVVSGIGVGLEENIQALQQKKHGMGKVTLFSTDLDVPVSEVKKSNEELKELLSLPIKKSYSRTALLGILAAREAAEDAQLDFCSERIGLISSTSVGGMDLSENFYAEFKLDNKKGRLRDVVSHDCGDSTEQIAKHLGIKGFVTTISTACSAAGNAIMMGARLIKNGYLDTVIVGGTDALCKYTLNGFNSLLLLDKNHCRPFDSSREGLNLGEGAGYLVLSSQPLKGKKPYCELSGYANVNEAYHATGSSPDGEGPFRAMSQAIRMAGIDKKDINYLNMHGTGTQSNDAAESMAILRLFKDKVPPFSSVKPFIGHTLAASEGIETVYSALSVHYGMIYPNLNFKSPIADSGLSPEADFKKGLQIKHVLSNAFGFGGNDSSLLFSKIEEK